MTPVNAEAFLGSDFTYFDLGFIRPQDKYTSLGSENRNGKEAWKIEEVPTSSWYYSKIVIRIDPTTGFTTVSVPVWATAWQAD